MKPLYQLVGIDVAMQLLRPGAKWEISNSTFTNWDDPRPCPSYEEIAWVINKIKELEDSIPTIYTDEQLRKTALFVQELQSETT